MRGKSGLTYVGVTVVIPCFNCETTIERALKSIAGQTARPKEVIVIDDCSSDDTCGKLAELQDAFGSDWLRVLRLPRNGGPSVARNAGWDAATQPYIAFLDADDSWHPQKIEVQLQWMESQPEVALTAHGSIVCTEGKEQGDCPLVLPPQVRLITKWMQLMSNRFSTPTVMLRTSLPYRFEPDMRYSEDALLWLKIILDDLPVYKIEAAMAYLHKPRFGASGLSGDLTAMFRGQLDACNRLWKGSWISWPEMVLLRVWLFAKYVRRVLVSASRGQWKKRSWLAN